MTSPLDDRKAMWVTTSSDPDLTKERISTWLSAVAMLAISTGLVLGLWFEAGWGPWSLCVGGLVLAMMISYADHSRKVTSQPEPDPGQIEPGGHPGRMRPTRRAPGPTSPGNIHTKGPGAEQ
jgi:hypothetical protein